MPRVETGLETLIDSGRLSDTSHLPEIQSWPELLRSLESIRTSEHSFKTVVLDTLNGFERLCHEHVCETSFNNDWTDRGFASYGKGPDVAIPEWISMLSLLDKIRAERKLAIVCLAHTKVKTFKNPEGPDFDRYAVDMNDKTWGVTHKWADMVLFGNFVTEAVKEKGALRAKGKGGRERMLYSERHAAYDAKNRHGLPEEIDCGQSGAEAWTNFVAALKSGRQQEAA
jgi:hypothetical protein